MIRVFIGSAHKYRPIEPVIEKAIRENASEPVDIEFMRPGESGLISNGCTGFTMFRYAVPELCGYAGYAIYLDVDMLVLGDIAELWQYRTRGKWACMEDGSTEVMVIDCFAHHGIPSIHELNRMRKGQVHPPLYKVIPSEWNCEDAVHAEAKLVHYTDLSRQPWFALNRDDEAARLWHQTVRDYAA